MIEHEQKDFDPYYKWLGIPPDCQPIDHYKLLGLRIFEVDSDVISVAADRQMAHVKTFAIGKFGKKSQEILDQLAQARLCLLNPYKKAQYDSQLLNEIHQFEAEDSASTVAESIKSPAKTPVPPKNTNHEREHRPQISLQIEASPPSVQIFDRPAIRANKPRPFHRTVVTYYVAIIFLGLLGIAIFFLGTQQIEPRQEVAVSFSRTNGSEEGPSHALFRVNLSNPLASDAVIELSLGGTARLDQDYRLENTASPQGNRVLVKIPTGSLSSELKIFIQDDNIVEPVETIELQLAQIQSLQAIPWAGNSIPKAILEIADNDHAVVSVTTSPSMKEFVIQQSHPSSTNTNISYFLRGTISDNETITRGSTVIIPSGATSTIVPCDDLNTAEISLLRVTGLPEVSVSNKYYLARSKYYQLEDSSEPESLELELKLPSDDPRLIKDLEKDELRKTFSSESALSTINESEEFREYRKLLDHALALIERGQDQEALKAIKKASRIHGEHYEVDFLLGLLHALRGHNSGNLKKHLDEARISFTKCIATLSESQPELSAVQRANLKAALNNRAVVNIQRDEFGDAFKDWELASELGSVSVAMHHNLALFEIASQLRSKPQSLVQSIVDLNYPLVLEIQFPRRRIVRGWQFEPYFRGNLDDGNPESFRYRGELSEFQSSLGVSIGAGFILTPSSAVEGAESMAVCSGGTDGKVQIGKIVFCSEQDGIALIKVDGLVSAPLSLSAHLPKEDTKLSISKLHSAREDLSLPNFERCQLEGIVQRSSDWPHGPLLLLSAAENSSTGSPVIDNATGQLAGILTPMGKLTHGNQIALSSPALLNCLQHQDTVAIPLIRTSSAKVTEGQRGLKEVRPSVFQCTALRRAVRAVWKSPKPKVSPVPIPSAWNGFEYHWCWKCFGFGRGCAVCSGTGFDPSL